MIEDKIKGLLAEQNKKVKDLCSFIDMTDTALRKIYARDSCEISTLKKIANFFNVSPCYFFEQQGSATATACDNGIAVGGNANTINSFRAIEEMIEEVSAQRKLTEKALAQIEQLVGVIAQMNNRTKG